MRHVYRSTLGIIGAVLTVGGGITWIVAGRNLAAAENVAAFSSTLGVPSSFNDSGVGGATVWMWVGIVATILGVLVLIAWVIVMAATGRTVEPQSERLDLEATRRRKVDGASTSLSDLVAMHQRGELTDDEFTAAKRNLLRI